MKGQFGKQPKQPEPRQAWRLLPDASCDPVSYRYEPGCTVLVFGSGLDFDMSREDEGVFLIDEAGSATRMTRIYIHEPSQVMFAMPEDAAGTYRLQVRHRHPKGKGSVLTGTMERSLVPM